eukprot:gene24634-10255_t
MGCVSSSPTEETEQDVKSNLAEPNKTTPARTAPAGGAAPEASLDDIAQPSPIVKPTNADVEGIRKAISGDQGCDSPRSPGGERSLARNSVENVNGLFNAPAPRLRRISLELNEMLDNHGRLSVEFSKDLRESFTGARVSASLAEPDSKHVLIFGNDGGPPLLLKRLVGKGGFGSVFVGDWDGREVAVKVVAGRNMEGTKGQIQHEQMTQLEAILMTIVDHDNVVRTYKVMCGSDMVAGDPAAQPVVDHDNVVRTYKVMCGSDMVAGDPAAEPGVKSPASKQTPSFYIIMENARFGSLWAGLVVGRFHSQLPQEASKICWDAWAAIETMKETVLGIQ